MHRLVLLLTIMSLAFVFSGARVDAATGVEDLYRSALSGFERGDSLNAFAQVNRAIEIDPGHGPSRVLRAGVFHGMGQYEDAWKDYSLAFRSRDYDVRYDAQAGLSDTFRELRKRRRITAEFIENSNPLDPSHPEELYIKAQLAYNSGTVEGNLMARRLVLKLVCFNPGYRGVYRMWRENFRDQSHEERLSLSACLEEFLSAHPDSTDWWLELARDHYALGRVEKALETLDRLENANPRFVSPEVPLLRARCKLEQGDERSFQYLYFAALDVASRTGDFSRLLQQTEAVFTSTDYREWEKFGRGGDRAAFLRRFWVRSNSDPFDPLNAALINHYRRLRHAELNYSLANLQSFEKYREQSGRLGLPQHELSDVGAPVIWAHAANLGFDPRGLLWIRFGAPDSVVRTPLDRFPGDTLETWRFGNTHFSFQRLGQGEDFVFRPMHFEKSLAEMIRFVQSERRSDPDMRLSTDYFAAQFLSPDGRNIELEFYQDESIPGENPPRAEVAIFDEHWRAVLVRESPVYREIIDGQRLWLAAHRVTVQPGSYRYALRLKSGKQKWIAQGVIDIDPFPVDRLSLSAVVLGSPPEGDKPAYARKDIPLIPRPSTRFRQGETVNVYLELYGLQADREGVRSYFEWVNVVRLKEGEQRVRKYQGRLNQIVEIEAGDTRTSLNHLFQRIAPPEDGPVAEVFTLETEGLLPGAYRLLIQARDASNGSWDVEETFFDIVPDNSQAVR